MSRHIYHFLQDRLASFDRAFHNLSGRRGTSEKSVVSTGWTPSPPAIRCQAGTIKSSTRRKALFRALRLMRGAVGEDRLFRSCPTTPLSPSQETAPRNVSGLNCRCSRGFCGRMGEVDGGGCGHAVPSPSLIEPVSAVKYRSRVAPGEDGERYHC